MVHHTRCVFDWTAYWLVCCWSECNSSHPIPVFQIVLCWNNAPHITLESWPLNSSVFSYPESTETASLLFFFLTLTLMPCFFSCMRNQLDFSVTYWIVLTGYSTMFRAIHSCCLHCKSSPSKRVKYSSLVSGLTLYTYSPSINFARERLKGMLVS